MDIHKKILLFVKFLFIKHKYYHIIGKREQEIQSTTLDNQTTLRIGYRRQKDIHLSDKTTIMWESNRTINKISVFPIHLRKRKVTSWN